MYIQLGAQQNFFTYELIMIFSLQMLQNHAKSFFFILMCRGPTLTRILKSEPVQDRIWFRRIRYSKMDIPNIQYRVAILANVATHKVNISL